MAWWHYLLLVNLYLLVFFGFYSVLLRKETFFQLNRIYLVAAAILSFVIPLLQSSWIKDLFITKQVQQTLFTISPEVILNVKPAAQNPVTIGQIIALIYIVGAVLLVIRLIFQLISLKKLFHNSQMPRAFSFFKAVKVDEQAHGRDVILQHEAVHVRQWHTADVLFIEAVMIINWFNPVVYLYRKSIKHVHEFIADQKAVSTGINKAEYAMLLLTQTFGAVPHHLSNTFFNHSLLKQRIMMLHKNPSQRRALLKYGLSAPLFAAMLVLSSATINNSKVVKVINKKTSQVFQINANFNTTTMTETGTTATKTEKTMTASLGLKQNIQSVKTNDESKTTLTGSSLTSQGSSIDTLPAKTEPVFMAVEDEPEFPGGMTKFMNFLSKHIRYPAEAKSKQISGRVIARFIVEKDGSLSNIKVIRDPGAGLGEEAVRVLSLSPNWKPGIQNKKPVRVMYTVPINFNLGGVAPQPVKRDSTVKKVMIIKTTDGHGIMDMNGRVGSLTVTDNRPDSLKKGFSVASPGLLTARDAKGNMTSLQPIYFLDGKEITKASLSTIDPVTIEKIQVFKGDAAITKYGEKGKNGVVLIILKKS
jgi:TonB family protein